MEKFDITEHGSYDLIQVDKRNFRIQVIHTDQIPVSLSDDHLIVFGEYETTGNAANGFRKMNIITGFCILDPDEIEYEPYLIDSLVQSAVNVYYQMVLGNKPDKITMSPGYKKKFIDSRPADPLKLSPELFAYITRLNPKDGLDFYEWKEKNLGSFLN